MSILIQDPQKDVRQLVDIGWIHPTATIHHGVYLGYNVYIGAHTEVKPNVVIAGSVRIGDNCLIAPNVSIIRGQKDWVVNDGFTYENPLYTKHEYKIKSPRIANNVFIGANSVVLMDILSNNVTIGALSFVDIVIEEEGTYVGNPIRKIKDYSIFTRIE